MYSAEYLVFVAKQHLPIELHSTIEKVAMIIPATGRLDKTLSDIAHLLGCTLDDLEKIVSALVTTSPPLVVRKEVNGLLFDYSEKDVNYVHHLRNALSNFGFEEQEFL